MTTHPIWRTSGGSNARRGQGAKPLSSTPQLTMQSHASAGITASPVCTATGNVVLADMAGQIQLTDTTGKPIWQKTLSAGIQATPVIPEDEGCVYAACYNGMVYAIDLKTGEPLWQIEVPSQFDARILSDLLFLPQHHLLILSSWGYQYSAIDTQNHSIVHTWEAGSNLYAGATAAADETVFLLRAKWAREKTNQAVELVQVDPQTGEETALHLVHPQEKAINFMKIASTPVLS
ncbi:MAG: PQQ-binding-like beta-propeller repeat protein, partial [bacterium]|nr:PQQ-binding-like beta-propeller repeat protein [bacterium]